MISRFETVVVTVLFAVMSLGLGQFMLVHYFVQAGDSAFIVDLLTRVADGHGLVSTAFNSAYSIFPIIGIDAEAYCRSEFKSLFRDVSGLRWHAYLIAYPMAWLTFIPGVTALGVVISSMVASFMGSLLLLALFLRRRGLPILVVIAFLVLLFLCKPWSDAIMGQFYFDRLFLLPGIALVLCVHLRLSGEKVSFVWIIALTTVCALVTERPAVMIGCFLIGYPVLCRGLGALRSRDCRWLMALGVACLVYVALYVALLQDSPYKDVLGGAAAIAALKAALLPGGTYQPQTMKLFAVLLPFFILAALEWRLCLVAAGAILPNLLLTIGGAEKNNFFTHYHMAYLPFLVAAATLGLLRIWSLFRPWLNADARWFSPRRVAFTGGTAAVLALMAVYSDRINTGDVSRTFVFNDPGTRALPTSLVPGLSNPLVDAWADQGRFLREFVSDIPDNSTVSTPEWLQPALVKRRGMVFDYAPIGLGANQYMILLYNPESGGELVLQVPSFRSGDEVNRIRACIQSRVDAYYTVMKQQEYRGGRYRIYALKK
ncbi:hypothetical protein [Tardiphaga sp. vice278]|uniref:hypothetical protein n=1 Tax=Tardiphaga sp. vice278 TaxID=2592815 RepID=UPI0011628CBB|nr:hypothetical protein [Tardiphaga sp. vice278]QDM17961.1 hypothetical protein FNL53_19915 [Tardiphaga sp. vice278]